EKMADLTTVAPFEKRAVKDLTPHFRLDPRPSQGHLGPLARVHRVFLKISFSQGKLPTWQEEMDAGKIAMPCRRWSTLPWRRLSTRGSCISSMSPLGSSSGTTRRWSNGST